MTHFIYNDIVKVRSSASVWFDVPGNRKPGPRIGERARIVSVTDDRSQFSRPEFPPGPLYVIAFEDGDSIEVHEADLELIERVMTKPYAVAKCDELYQSVLNLSGSGNYTLFDLAQCFIDGYDPTKLREMLLSEDDGIVSDGLFVLSETGQLAEQFAAEIKMLFSSDDAEVRRKAVNLAATYSVT